MINHTKATAICWGIASLFMSEAALARNIDTHIRTLAASCAACHGTNGISVAALPSLAGLDENYFISKMKKYRASSHVSEIMVQHAKGLTEDEITGLAAYFSGQPKTCFYCRID